MIDNHKISNDKRLPLLGLAICSLVFVLASLAGVYVFFSPATPIAALIIEPKVFDFGTVSEGQYSTSFTLKNNLRRPISILHAVGSCSCTTVSFRETLIPPGKSVMMTCILDTTGKSGRFQSSLIVGYVLEDVSIIDEETTVKPSYVTIDLRATVKSEIQRVHSNAHSTVVNSQ